MLMLVVKGMGQRSIEMAAELILNLQNLDERIGCLLIVDDQLLLLNR
jgi:hypothetical protein